MTCLSVLTLYFSDLYVQLSLQYNATSWRRESCFLTHLCFPPHHQVAHPHCTCQYSTNVFDKSISQASLAKVVTCRYCLALWKSFNPACRFSWVLKITTTKIIGVTCAAMRNNSRESQWQWEKGQGVMSGAQAFDPASDQETALRNYIQKGAAGEHPHSTPVPMTLRTQETAPERPCSMSHTGSEEGEPLSLAPAWKLERFPDTRIAERLSRCNRNACALPWLPILAISLLLVSTVEGSGDWAKPKIQEKDLEYTSVGREGSIQRGMFRKQTPWKNLES